MSKVTIEVDARFGSDFQRSFANDLLLTALKAWMMFFNRNAGNNTVSVTLGGVDVGHIESFTWRE